MIPMKIKIKSALFSLKKKKKKMSVFSEKKKKKKWVFSLKQKKKQKNENVECHLLQFCMAL